MDAIISDGDDRMERDIGAKMLLASREANNRGDSTGLSTLVALGDALYKDKTLCCDTIIRYGGEDAIAVIAPAVDVT